MAIETVSKKNYGWFILGLTLIALSLGSLNSIPLVRSGASFLIFIAATFLSIFYMNTTFTYHRRGEKIPGRTRTFGLIGSFLLMLFFGVQAPQLPFKEFILLGGLLLVLPALKETFMERAGS